MEIGNRLKEAREAKNLSLQDIQGITKIQVRYLDAIEKGNFEIMPGNFYVRAFIKEYAGAVGLNPEHLMEEHANELPSPTDDTTIQYSRVQRSRNNTGLSARMPANFSFLPTLFVAVLIIGTLVAIWFFSQSSTGGSSNDGSPVNSNEGVEEVVVNEESEEDNKETQNEQAQSGNNPVSDDEQNTEEVQETAEPALEVISQGSQDGEETVTYTLTNPPEKLMLVIDTSYEHWLEVTNENGEHLIKKMFYAKDAPFEVDLSDQETFAIRFGNPSELDVTVGGEPLTLPEETNKSLIHRVTVKVENNTEAQ